MSSYADDLLGALDRVGVVDALAPLADPKHGPLRPLRDAEAVTARDSLSDASADGVVWDSDALLHWLRNPARPDTPASSRGQASFNLP